MPGAVRAHYLKADRRADRTLPPRARRRRHRLPAARHEPAARARAAGVSLDPRRGRSECCAVFLLPLFLAGAAAAAVPIVLHLLKREPEPRVKFAAVKLLKQRAGRAHREAAPARAAAARAAHRHARAAGARLRAAVLRDRRGASASSGVTDRRARHVVQHVGARPVRAREAAREGRDRARAGRRSGRRRHVRRRSGDRGEADGGSHAGGGGDRSGGAWLRRDPISRRRCRPPRRHLGGRRGDRSSSSPICRRTAGTPATARRCRTGTTIEVADVGAMPPNLAVDRGPAAADRVVATVRNSGPRRA